MTAMSVTEIITVLVVPGVTGLFMFFKWRDARHFKDIDDSIAFLKKELIECKRDRAELQSHVADLQEQLRSYIEHDLTQMSDEVQRLRKTEGRSA